MRENVRLIVWDLDETFWYGTLTEGGIRIRPEVCAMVKTLVERGIMCTICSKNNFDDVKAVLEREGVWDYFIFPSINWEPKGARVAALVETVQLRAPTVMFIDDNPMNLEEVRHFVPGIQVESHEYIPEILDSPLFVGKPDPARSRLAQYKLLETRKRDEQATAGASGDNTAFLRASDIRVFIDSDVAGNIDRAIELINRTNQLNYTKKRLPENMDEARRILLEEVGRFDSQAGLVRVVDRYGDYGYVGFFLSATGRRDNVAGSAWQRLLYFCFSCRTLGMYVEQWLYNHLRQPELDVVGEVLTDLSVPRDVDWVRQVASLTDAAPAVEKVAPEIRVHGGCEGNAVAHYLAAHADKVSVTGNFATGGLFVRLNSAATLLSSCASLTPAFEQECRLLEVPYHAMAFDYFGDAPAGTVFVFSGGMDDASRNHRYRHKQHGWELKIEPNGNPELDVVRATDQDVLDKVNQLAHLKPDAAVVLKVCRHIHDHYETVTRGDDEVFRGTMRRLLDQVPEGCKLVIVLDAVRARGWQQPVTQRPWVAHFNALVRDLVAPYPFVRTICFEDFILDDSEVLSAGNHYERMVYSRLSEALIEAVKDLPIRQRASEAA